ncbi:MULTISPECIES: metal-dependent hydrolase family protein [unclassified Tenacibaculum]|uniref:metal-dependent hydrolase family protein n=1 Tax=unclassified Tenacibaculum TaxID=2635139 RepID=UPI001F39A236|nr:MULTISPECIES: amidohydrolase family protein [unclassified Tenacibaculum]MCF2876264.1 amidohydrolase family protein [Tenacibaculum sp. Cn5-1]MCF2936339.1 amidohydrolase family protein [Tenacibaculum sp. Cn5-34]MCG7511682.1 amidohydrolase family protein [Tenacibaculum sp. Cn5-46]
MKKISLFIFLICIITSVKAQNTYILCGKIIDTEKGVIKEKQTLVVNGNKITNVFNGYILPRDKTSKTIDLKDKVVLPGLIDMHVHIESEHSPKTRLNRYIKNEADVAFNSVGFAKTTLLKGFTTVRDLGGTGVNIAIRKAINAGKIPGPRVFTAGKALATTGGHADPTNGSSRRLIGNPGPKEGVVNSVEDAKKAVRQRYKNGADCIKITATGGVLSVAKSGDNPQFTVEEIKAICDMAKDYGMHVAAHAHGDEGMQRAIIGGVKTIEHGTYMSDKTMELMKKHNAYLVPTITAGKEVEEKAKVKDFYPAIVVPKALAVGPQIQGTFAKAYKKGVGIAFGTDAGVFKHGNNAKEFGYMVEAGMPAMEAIQSATITNAKILEMENEIGQLRKGFLADIVAVNEDPTKNINTMENVVFVMKNGKVYKKK